ncbi:MAG: leucine-rich repeat domain-containing protein [Lachnospira sp.]
MNKKILKRLWSCFIIAIMLFNLSACTAAKDGQNDKAQNENVEENSAQTDSEGEISIDDLKEDDEIHFSDFLVERCVRKTLNKSWDDKVTKADAASITSLVISPIYDPTLGMNFGAGISRLNFYEGYIDLCDLRYLTGLEILKIDNLVDYDMVVNVDSITNCKNLKRIYMQWNPTSHNLYSGAGYGYRYWADIISELPALEYMDLGIYVDSHMKQIMLSKSSNKQITFFNGNNDCYAQKVLNTDYWRFYNPIKITDIANYTSAMKYQYYGNNDDTDVRAYIPLLKISSEDELNNTIDTLSEDTEDLSLVLWKGCSEFDFSLLSKFKNLTTLTIAKEGAYIYYTGGRTGYEYVEMKNTDKLAELPYLQAVNLCACKGDISYIQNVTNLRELTLYACNVTGIKAIGKTKRLTELRLFQTDCENIKNELSSEDEYNLDNLKLFKVNGKPEQITSYLEALECMPKLQTICSSMDISDLSMLNKCTKLENIRIEGISADYVYDLKDIASLTELKTICIPYSQATNISEIINNPKLVSVVIPNGHKGMTGTELNALLQSAAANNKLSMISLILTDYYNSENLAKFNKETVKKLYDNGISDDFVQRKITFRAEIKEKTFEQAWSQIYKN